LALLWLLALSLAGCASVAGTERGPTGEAVYRLQSDEPPAWSGAGKVGRPGDDKEDADEGPPPPPFLLHRLREVVQEDDPDGSGDGEDYEDRLWPRSSGGINITRPDPDTANFPNSAFTIPQGRVYVENSPVSFYGPSVNSPRLNNWEFLLRYGVTDRLEFRIFSNGFTNQYGRLSTPTAGGRTRRRGGDQPPFTQGPTTGFSPLAFDLKMHLWDESRKDWLPAAGLEVYIETNLGSPAFNQGTQPSINLLFDHSLPGKIGFEWNAGIAGNQAPNGAIFYNFAFQWALQRQVLFEGLTVFTHGYLNNAALPRFGQPLRSSSHEVIVTGVGASYEMSNRTAVFGSYNFGLTPDSPDYLALFGFAFAL
jgi:hypothetical protein